MTFHEAMLALYKRIKEETGYNPKAFLSMVVVDGGWQTARRLLNSATPQPGFERLWAMGRSDLTVEALVLQPQWRDMFTEAELKTAQDRLTPTP